MSYNSHNNYNKHLSDNLKNDITVQILIYYFKYLV